MSQCTKTFISPIGELTIPYAITYEAADRGPLFSLNRYPKQVIGFTLRLPDGFGTPEKAKHYRLSIVWAKPARWWK